MTGAAPITVDLGNENLLDLTRTEAVDFEILSHYDVGEIHAALVANRRAARIIYPFAFILARREQPGLTWEQFGGVVITTEDEEKLAKIILAYTDGITKGMAQAQAAAQSQPQPGQATPLVPPTLPTHDSQGRPLPPSIQQRMSQN